MADLTREQYERAISLAERDGNMAARDALIQEAAAKLTGKGTMMEQLGAGVQDLVLGAKQLVGKASTDDVREQNRIANMATGGTVSGELMRGLGSSAPLLMVPGGSVARAAMMGAGQGALMPTENENQLAGRVTNAVTGGVTGGAAQAAAPLVGKVLTKTLRGASDFLPGGMGRVAEREFVNAIPEGGRAAAEQALRASAGARTAPYAVGVSGAPETAGVATRQPALLAAEREAREAGGNLAQPFKQLDEDAAQAWWQHLEGNVGGDLQKLKLDKEDIHANLLLNVRNRKPFDPKGRLWGEIQAAAANEHNPGLKAELERIRDHYMSAVNSGEFAPLHDFRQQALDDTLARLYQTDKKAGNAMRKKIEGFEATFDTEMNKSLGGNKWSDYLDEYSKAATALDQATAGEKFLSKARTWNETPGGVPQLTGKRQQLADLATKVDERNQRPVVSQQASDALQTVRSEIGEAKLPYEYGPKGSATAANQNPSTRVLGRALAAQKREAAGYPGMLGIGGFLAGDLGTGIAAGYGLKLLDKRAMAIADQLLQIHVDPARAAQVLQKANLSPAMKTAVMQQLQRAASVPGRIAAPMAATAVDQRINQPQE